MKGKTYKIRLMTGQDIFINGTNAVVYDGTLTVYDDLKEKLFISGQFKEWAHYTVVGSEVKPRRKKC